MINGGKHVIYDKSIFQNFLSINFYYEEYNFMQIKNANKVSGVVSLRLNYSVSKDKLLSNLAQNIIMEYNVWTRIKIATETDKGSLYT